MPVATGGAAVSVPVERWVAGGAAVVVPDPAAHVPDRRAFAAAHCRRADRVTLDADHVAPDAGRVAGDADDAEDVDHARDADHADDASDPDRVADGVLFLAPDPDPTPPRVVATLVGPRDRRPVGPDAARVAAAWTARRTGADAVMVDTARGTRRATVDGDVWVEHGGDSEGDATTEREVAVGSEGAIGNQAAVDHEVTVEVPRPAVRVVECDDPSALADDDAMADGGAVASDGAVTDGGRTRDGGGVVAFVRDATSGPVDDRAADADGTAGDARPPVLATASDDGSFRCRVVQEAKDRATAPFEVGAVTHGAAAVAVATAAVRTGRARAGEEVSVSTPGGSVVVTVPDAGHALVCGRARKVGSELLERAVL